MFFEKIGVFLKRDFLEAKSYKTDFLFSGLTILAHLVTFFFVAKLLGSAAEEHLGAYGGGYFPFVMVGIATAGFSASALSAFPKGLSSEQGAGTLEAIALTPTSLWTPLLASFFWALLVSGAQLALYFLAGKFLFKIDFAETNFLALVVFLSLSVSSLSGIGLLSAAYSLAYKRGDPVSFFFNVGSRFLAGVYFPVSILPAWLQKLSLLIPMNYSLEAVRKALLQGVPLRALWPQALALFGFSAMFLPLGVIFFNLALKKAKKDGSLSFV